MKWWIATLVVALAFVVGIPTFRNHPIVPTKRAEKIKGMLSHSLQSNERERDSLEFAMKRLMVKR